MIMFTRLTQMTCLMALLFAASARAENIALPPPPAPPVTPAIGDKDVVETLKADGHYTTFLTALDTARMTEQFRGKGDFTFFVPNDEAFKKMANFAELQRDQAGLAAFLKGHIVSGHRYMTKDFVKVSGTVAAMDGASLTFSAKEDKWKVNGAQILRFDMPASNGIIHEIDAVLNDGKSGLGLIDKTPFDFVLQSGNSPAKY